MRIIEKCVRIIKVEKNSMTQNNRQLEAELYKNTQTGCITNFFQKCLTEIAVIPVLKHSANSIQRAEEHVAAAGLTRQSLTASRLHARFGIGQLPRSQPGENAEEAV